MVTHRNACHAAVRVKSNTKSTPIFLHRDLRSSTLYLYMASREANKPLLLSAILESKDEVAMIRLFFPDFFLDIEVQDVDEDVNRSYYSVSLNVADKDVAKSSKSKPRSSVVKWEWKANNKM